MRLLELNEHAVPFGPTPSFRKVYGRYCGFGNAGGDPIDDVDRACMNHDRCYHENGRDSCDCDQKFRDELHQLLKSKLTGKQRLAALTMLVYFKAKRRCA